MGSARGITVSTVVKIARRIDLSISSAVKQWRGIPQWSSNKINKNRFSTNTNTHHDFPPEIGYTVDLTDLLSTPERDFLIRNNNGQKVPISSLKGKLVGLYFCENISHPHPRMQAIKEVYEEAKSRGYDFEIVQIPLHYYHPSKTRELGTDPTVSWLTVPFTDPSCRKIQSIFECVDDGNICWYGDCLVLMYPCQPEDDDSSGVFFEFEGAKILEQWGIEGYPFTRPSLYKAEYELQKRKVTLQSLFPPGGYLLRSARDGFDLVDADFQLSGKRVLVLLAPHYEEDEVIGKFISMMKCEYEAQVEDNVAEQSKFEVVYVSTAAGYYESSFDEVTKDMPWLVRPFSAPYELLSGFLKNVFRTSLYDVTGPAVVAYPAAVAFNEQGELIAKEDGIGEKKEGDKLRFPFIDQDLEKRIRGDVERLCPSVQCKKNHDLSTAVKQCNNRDLSIAVKQCRVKGLPFSKKDRYKVYEIGYTVDVADLLFTPERDFLVKNNGQKVKIDDLRGKTIVLFIIPLDKYYYSNEFTVDMIDAYSELLRVGSVVEFVFVPVRLENDSYRNARFVSQEDLFNHIFSTVPFPAIPFSDVQGREGTVVQTFSVDDDNLRYHYLPYWVVIDPTNTVEATRYWHPRLFKLFGGAELHPLSRERISAVEDCYEREARRWDQLLTSDTRDFLLSNNGDKVPISSLKGKLIGLYFCENIPHPPRMRAIKKVYEEAKSRGYDFEIVQITFHYYPVNAKHLDTDPTVKQCCEDISWLSLPFKDPSCRKIHRIILGWNCKKEEEEEEDARWIGEDSLVLIKDEGDHNSGVLYEFSGAGILQRWGIEGYPFTRPALYKAEYEVQKKEIRLQSLFPPGKCLLRRSPVGDGFDLVDALSQLSGKKVLVLFAPHSEGDWEVDLFDRTCNFIYMLRCEYEAQVEDNVAEESKFEVVYVSTDFSESSLVGGYSPRPRRVSTSSRESSFDEFTRGMPWLVRHFSSESRWDLFYKVFPNGANKVAAAAFNEQGELIAKEGRRGVKMEGDELLFPFIDPDLEWSIREEVEGITRFPFRLLR